MYITKEELDRRLNKRTVDIVSKERKERKSKDENGEGGESRLNDNERALIGILGREDNQKNVAELMGVSKNTVSLASRGITTVASGVDKELVEKVNEGRETIAKDKLENEKKIQDQLLTNLAAALGHVANNLDHTDANEASKIAVDMSKILDRVSGNREERHGNRTAIIINVPQMKEERNYQTLTV